MYINFHAGQLLSVCNIQEDPLLGHAFYPLILLSSFLSLQFHPLLSLLCYYFFTFPSNHIKQTAGRPLDFAYDDKVVQLLPSLLFL